jgi:hypothetical protein
MLLEGVGVKRAVIIASMVLLLAMLAACSGGDGNVVDPNAGPLTIQLVWAEPGTGSSPLRVVFTANITGGEAPYYYAWDFTNDGSIDTYQNNELRRTVSVAHEYYLKASDAGGVSQYEAILTVTDSLGTEIASAPVTVNVQGTSGFTVDPDNTGATSDEIDAEGHYVFTSGNPVYFRAYPSGGVAPYSYQWDFDMDGAIDSTITAPQYTFSYTGVGVKVFVVSVTIADAKGEKALWDFFVAVENPNPDPNPPPPPFDVVINSTPPGDANDVIHVDFDPTGINDNIGLEPMLDLAVIVNPETPGGSPPYEYYWDFENDGAIDSQALSPTIPYYDNGRKIEINPYMHTESQKSYTLRCMVIDSNGFTQDDYRTIISRNVAGVDDAIYVDYNYTVAGMDVPFAEADNRASITNTQFTFDITGAPGTTYEYQFDANGDGTPEDLDINSDGTPDLPIAGWYIAGAASTSVPVHVTFPMAFGGIGYFPANMTIRAVSSDSTVVATRVIETPVSLVKLSQYSMDVGVLEPRTDHCIVANWTAVPNPVNTNALGQREIIVAGGRQGITPLNTSQRILQAYNTPISEGQIEALASTEVAARSALNQERRGSVMWIDGPETGSAANIRIHGGINVLNGFLASNEMASGGAGNVPWTVLNEIRIPAFYPLKDASGTFVPGVGYMFGGGLHKASTQDTTVVSRKLITYDTVFDAYSDTTNMQVARYDAGVAYANGKVYVIGGRVSSGQAVATVESYDPVTRMWDTFTPSLNEPRAAFACEVIGGRIYVVGGGYWPNDESAATLLTTAEVFNPATGVWSYTVPLPIGGEVEDLASTISPAPGGVSSMGALANSMLCMGGRDVAGSETNAFYEFVCFTTVILPGPTEASLSGYLTNALDSTPIEGIQVEIGNALNWPVGDPPFSDSATTDATGFYEFVDLPTGTDRSYTVGIIFGGGYTWDPPLGQTFDPFINDVTNANFQGTPE